MSLGEKLQKIKTDLENQNTARQRREAEISKRKLEKEKQLVNAVFQNAWTEMVEAIADEKMPKGIKVEDYGHPFRENKTPANHAHPYHDIYLFWLKEAANEGLTLHIVNNHDGCGMRDWEVVTFTLDTGKK